MSKMVNFACKFILLHLLNILMSTTSLSSTNTTINTTAQRNKPDGRIVGGTEAYIYQFPYQVSIQQEGVHRCGGAVYSQTIIVSAAHCFELWDMPELYAVRAGSTEHARGGVYLAVRRIILHAQFKPPNGIDNDIAVLALAYPLPFNIYVQPISLATRADMAAATQTVYYVSGWGAIAEGSRLKAPGLRFATVRQVEQNACKAALAGIVSVTEGMMCAGVPGGGQDSCQGDSGGPLAGYLRGRLVLVGIVSFGVGCGRPNYPGIYTRVAEYVDWIDLAASRI